MSGPYRPRTSKAVSSSNARKASSSVCPPHSLTFRAFIESGIAARSIIASLWDSSSFSCSVKSALLRDVMVVDSSILAPGEGFFNRRLS